MLLLLRTASIMSKSCPLVRFGRAYQSSWQGLTPEEDTLLNALKKHYYANNQMKTATAKLAIQRLAIARKDVRINLMNPVYTTALYQQVEDIVKDEVAQGKFSLFSTNTVAYLRALQAGIVTVDPVFRDKMVGVAIKNLAVESNLSDIPVFQFQMVMGLVCFSQKLVDSRIVELEKDCAFSSNLIMALVLGLNSCNVRLSSEALRSVLNVLRGDSDIRLLYFFQFMSSFSRTYYTSPLANDFYDFFNKVLYRTEIDEPMERPINDLVRQRHIPDSVKQTALIKAEPYLIKSPRVDIDVLCWYRRMDDPKYFIRNRMWTSMNVKNAPISLQEDLLRQFRFQLPGITNANAAEDKGRELYFRSMTNLIMNRPLSKLSYALGIIMSEGPYKDVCECLVKIMRKMLKCNWSSVLSSKTDTILMTQMLAYVLKNGTIDRRLVLALQEKLNFGGTALCEELYPLFYEFAQQTQLYSVFVRKLVGAVETTQLQPAVSGLYLLLVTGGSKLDPAKVDRFLRVIVGRFDQVTTESYLPLRLIAGWLCSPAGQHLAIDQDCRNQFLKTIDTLFLSSAVQSKLPRTETVNGLLSLAGRMRWHFRMPFYFEDCHALCDCVINDRYAVILEEPGKSSRLLEHTMMNTLSAALARHGLQALVLPRTLTADDKKVLEERLMMEYCCSLEGMP